MVTQALGKYRKKVKRFSVFFIKSLYKKSGWATGLTGFSRKKNAMRHFGQRWPKCAALVKCAVWLEKQHPEKTARTELIARGSQGPAESSGATVSGASHELVL